MTFDRRKKNQTGADDLLVLETLRAMDRGEAMSPYLRPSALRPLIRRLEDRLGRPRPSRA
jgi:hypothetical protein